MLVRLIALPFALMALVILYLAWEVDDSYGFYLVIPGIALAVLYSLSPQINWWWYLKHPPALDKPLVQLLENFHPFYRQLLPGQQERFRNRMALFMEGTDFMSQSEKEIPEDVKGAIAMQAVHVGFGQSEFLFSKFEKVVVYPGAFPSPQHPRHFHASEIFEEDGVVLLSAQHLMQAVAHPGRGYNVGLHEYAKVFMLQYPEYRYPVFTEQQWPELEKIGKLTREQIGQWIGLPEFDIAAVAIHHFLNHPAAFFEFFPEEFYRFRDIFHFDPLKPDSIQLPVVA